MCWIARLDWADVERIHCFVTACFNTISFDLHNFNMFQEQSRKPKRCHSCRQSSGTSSPLHVLQVLQVLHVSEIYKVIYKMYPLHIQHQYWQYWQYWQNRQYWVKSRQIRQSSGKGGTVTTVLGQTEILRGAIAACHCQQRSKPPMILSMSLSSSLNSLG